MDPRFGITPEDLYSLQMEVKQVHYTQSNHAERIMRLEKRQADDAALKSVWNSPFPGVLSGTPQHGKTFPPPTSSTVILAPVSHNALVGPISQPDDFDDLDEQGDELLGSLHLGPTEEEPVRRGAASRANSVRFDESALHGSSWAGHASRPSGDFTPARPGSGLLMERTFSHKSDGRHSSAGHSVHSHHSGRASSLGLDTNFAVGDEDDDSSLDIPGPPPAFYILGTVPSIVRCWLTTNYAHATLLYADICTGSQRSTVDYSLVKELGLQDEVDRGVDGVGRVRLSVYLAEAVVVHHSGRSPSLNRPIPFISVLFEVTGSDAVGEGAGSGVRIFIGSDALRAHSADIMFSRNTMIIYGDDKSRLRVPFVRPEDENAFQRITTTNTVPEKPRLNANAAPFVLGEGQERPEEQQHRRQRSKRRSSMRSFDGHERYHHHDGAVSPTESGPRSSAPPASASDTGGESERSTKSRDEGRSRDRDGSVASEARQRAPSSSGGIWSSWRQGAGGAGGTGGDGQGPLSGYQPAARSGRSMKVLKPQKSSASSSARTGASYEPPPPTPSGTGGGGSGTTTREGRRKSLASNPGGEREQAGGSSAPSNRWEQGRRAASSGSEAATKSSTGRDASRGESRQSQSQSNTLPRSANNPVGGASAFSWMGPPGGGGKPKTSTTTQ